jgi:hypothetical protein
MGLRPFINVRHPIVNHPSKKKKKKTKPQNKKQKAKSKKQKRQSKALPHSRRRRSLQGFFAGN